METKEIKIDIPKGYEIDKENSTFECIKFKKIHQVNTWRQLPCLKGGIVDTYGKYFELVPNCYGTKVTAGNCLTFINEKYAKSAIALAKISQLMPYYGGEITEEEWKNDEWKYPILVDRDGISFYKSTHVRELINFHTEEQRARFLSFPENVQLVKDLYMMD